MLYSKAIWMADPFQGADAAGEGIISEFAESKDELKCPANTLD